MLSFLFRTLQTEPNDKSHWLFLCKTSPRSYLYKQATWVQISSSSGQSEKGEEHPHIVVREMVSVSSSWWEQREREERDRIVRPQNPFSLSLLSIAFPPQQRSPDSPDIAALWHSIISQRLQAMGKGSVSWSTWGAKLKSGNMWAFEAGHKRRQSVSD